MKPDPTVCLSIFIVCALWRVVDRGIEWRVKVVRVRIREDSFRV